MALIIADRVKETTITSGVGTLTLSGSTFGGFQTFAEAIGDGNTTYYCIQNEGQFEIGVGTYTSSGNTLSRDTVFQSSNSDNKINISGVGLVFCVVPADKLVYKDGDDSVVFPTPFVFKRSDDGDYWQALSTDYTNRVASFYIEEGTDPTWKIGLKTSTSEIIAPYYAYVSGKDGFVELRGNASSILSIGDEDAQGLQVNHQLKNIIDIRKNGGEIAIQNLDLNSDETTSAKNNSIAYTVFAVESSAGHAADLQTWSVATDEKASLNQYGDFETIGSIIAPSGRFTAIRFSDGSIQTTAALPFASGALIDQNAADIITQSGYFQSAIDLIDSTAVSGWAESYIDQTSGNLQVQIDINESNISTVSGLIGDADFLPGASGGLIDQNSQDILTVSGLLYDDSAVSGYFESRVDSADSAINTVSGLLTPSGESFNFAGNLLTYNNSDGGSFTADLSSLSTFDTSGVSLAYSAGTLTYTNNAGGSFDVDISSISGDVYALIVDGAPTTLDTLNEIAAALNDDENIANTLTTLISTTSGNLQSQITSNDGDITQLNSDITTVSGLLYDDSAISGYFESRVDQADTDIATVSGLLYDDAAISGYFESRVDQADTDIATVSGLLYDDAAISGYFESRVDQADADIVTVSGLLYDDAAISGYFESRVDQADADIVTVSGLLDSVTPTGTPSGVGFFDNTGSLSGNSSFTYDGANVRLFGNIDVSGISTFGSGIKTYLRTEADATTITFDMDQSNNYTAELGGNRTLAVSNVDAGQKFTIRLTQDATGSRVPTWWSGITWLTSDGSDPTLKTGSGEIDYFGFISTSGGYYEGFHLTEVATGGGGGSSTLTVKEADGTPNVSNVSTIVVSNGTLTNDGGGQVTITTGGGGGGSYDDTYISGVSTFASGLAIQNQADIATVSGLLYDDTAISGYFESRVDQADSDITTVSGLIPPNTFDITGGDGTNYTIDAMGLNSASDPTMYLHKGHTYIFNKTFSGHPFRISDTDGGSVYQDADGNNIEIGSSAGAVTFEVPQDAPDKLYYYCTAHPSTMKGVIYTTADGATSGYFESRVDQADTDIATVSGLLYDDTAISGYFESRVDQADSDIATVSGLLYDDTAISGYFESRVDTNEAQITAVSGWAQSYVDSQDHSAAAVSGALQPQITSNDADIAYLSGIAVYGSGQTLQSVTDSGNTTSNAIIITNNNITASSGLFDSLDMTPLAEANYPAHQEGVVFYDADSHTLSLYNDEADVTLQLGQEEFLRVRNNTGATINNGTAVLITGSHGNAAPTISGAIATSESTSQIVGLATHSIEDSSFGYVTTYGIVRDVDTSAFSAGDELYLSATQIGSGVNVSPTIPNYKVTIGHVIRSHGANGSILVQIGHAKLGGGDLKSEAELNLSGVPFVTTKSNTTAGGSQTDPLFIFDSGNRQLQLGSGLQLLDGVPSNTSNVLYNDAGTLKFNGSAIGGGGGTTYTAGSGLSLVGTEFNVYGGSGNFRYAELTASDEVPTFKYLGSGVTDTPINLEVRSSFQSATGSGTALLFQGTQGQLFSITDNLSSGTIFNVSDITGLPMLEVTASGDVEIGEFADNITIHQPVLLSGGVPSNTTNKLYNNNGSLYFNGSSLGYDDAALSGYFQTEVDLKADIANPTFTGTPAAPTASAGTNTTQIATTAYVTTAIANLVDGAPTTLDTLNEIAAALNDDANVATTLTNLITTTSGNLRTDIDLKLENIVEDTTPQLGGTLDANGNSIDMGTNTITDTKVGQWDTAYGWGNHASAGYLTSVTFSDIAGAAVVTEAEGISSNDNDTTLPTSAAVKDYVDNNAGGGSSYTAGSGLTLAGTEFNVYGGSGNFENIDLTTDAAVVPKMVFTGSGVTDTPIRMKVLSSHASASTSGTALVFEGTEGQLFGITDNLSSGKIFSVNDITGLPLISADASGDVELAEFGRDIIAHKPITLQSGVPSVTTNKLYNDGYGLYFNGSAVGGGSSYNDVPLSGYFESRVDQADIDIATVSGLIGGGGGSYTAGSGLTLVGTEFNVYGGSGNFEYIDLTTDSSTVPKMVFTGSGVNNSSITLRVESNFQSATGSGTALLFEGEEGVLFSITDNLSSGVIFNVTNDLGLPLMEVEAYGDVSIGENASGIILHQPVLLSGGVPTDTTNKLYNDAGTLKFNGSAIGGGSSYNDVPLSGYFESRVDQADIDIATVSGLLYDDTAISGYFESRVDQADADIISSSGYFEDNILELVGVSGIDITSAGSTVNISAGSLSGYFESRVDQADTDIVTVSGLLYDDTAISGYFESRVDSADTNISTNSSSITANSGYFESRVDSADSSITANSGYFESRVDSADSSITANSGYFESRVDSADSSITANSGYFESRVDTNAADIITVSGLTNYTAGSGLTLSGTEFNVYGGSGNFESIDLTTDSAVVPKMVFTGSGVNNSPITLRVESNFQSATGSGTALLFEGEEGVLFSITDNLSSGVIFNVTNDLGLPLVEVEAYGDVKIGENASGITLYQPVLISGGVPANTTNKLYNDAGTLKFNGSAIGGGAVSAVANGVDNRVATFSSSDALNGEANLTFDGSTLAVNGAFTATTKSFLIDHPTKEGMKLQYASLEGPENGVYIRGTSGSNIITLPEYWSTLVDQSTVTVSLTPIGYYQALYIEEKGKNYIKVGGSKGSYDYVVYGERKDVEKLKVEW